MPKLSPISSRKLVKILRKLDFDQIRQRGSHARFVHSDGRRTTVPMHVGEKIGRGLLRKIIKDVGLSVKEFDKLR